MSASKTDKEDLGSFKMEHTHHDYHSWELTIPQKGRAGIMIWGGTQQDKINIRNGSKDLTFDVDMLPAVIDALTALEEGLMVNGDL